MATAETSFGYLDNYIVHQWLTCRWADHSQYSTLVKAVDALNAVRKKDRSRSYRVISPGHHVWN